MRVGSIIRGGYYLKATATVSLSRSSFGRADEDGGYSSYRPWVALSSTSDPNARLGVQANVARDVNLHSPPAGLGKADRVASQPSTGTFARCPTQGSRQER
ncbi:hypothetical protein B0H03_101168 [Rathayibacter iranicus NCPPB 2253 = VKM Ac-1602]|uniref:Uncharacterized protein n=1 Tax=Rathayibacter iranicus NCPPB 2253 = VKM Ac-1602 TaxID=1328868 RepID=A0ABX5LJA0_9MICO|nr:hypothetical protein B0H03_101168 [Rathayibacter iranicus NCPPB 2253 = VKM Ac-1602]